MTSQSESPKFLAVDFYCGAGGTTRGLLDAGGYVIAGIDKDKACEVTYRRNNPNMTLDCANPQFIAMDMFPATKDYPHGQQEKIRDKLDILVRDYQNIAPGIPLLFAICAPCQSFTKFTQPNITEKRLETRNRDQNLLFQTIDFIKRFSPDMIISENVAGISRGKYKHIWKGFQLKLQELGYIVGDGEVCVSRFGIAQHRRRSILFALSNFNRSNLDFTLKIPCENANVSPVTVRSVIDKLPPLQAGEDNPEIPNHRCRNLSDINRRRLMSVKPGEPNFNFSDELVLACHRKLEGRGKRGFGDVYTRIYPDRPAPTITTRFHSVSNGRFGHYDETQVRGLSLREGALLQSFSKDYEFYGTSMDSIAKMIGNAVPPKLSEFMTTSLYELWSCLQEVEIVNGSLFGDTHG